MERHHCCFIIFFQLPEQGFVFCPYTDLLEKHSGPMCFPNWPLVSNTTHITHWRGSLTGGKQEGAVQEGVVGEGGGRWI